MSGIGWYEAAAYAEFVEKSLPTVYHWNRAAGVYDSSVARMIMNGNFGASGSAPVGKFRGISPFGAFDMDGNVREWVWNGALGSKYLLGGSWGTLEYLFFEAGELLSPFDRSVTNGFLLGNSALPPSAKLDVPADLPPFKLPFGQTG